MLGEAFNNNANKSDLENSILIHDNMIKKLTNSHSSSNIDLNTLGNCFQGIGIAYFEMNEFEKSHEFHLKAQGLEKQIDVFERTIYEINKYYWRKSPEHCK